MNKQLLKTSGADVLSSRKKLRKTLGGGIHPSSLVCPRVNFLLQMTYNELLLIESHALFGPEKKVNEGEGCA